MKYGLARLLVVLIVLMLIAIVACVLGVIYKLFIQGAYERHFELALPQSARLIHYEEHRSGFNDMSYCFVFEVSDDALRNQLVSEWELSQTTVATASGALESLSIPWLPPVEERRSTMEEYGWRDDREEQYRGIWVDQKRGLIYAESGNW